MHVVRRATSTVGFSLGGKLVFYGGRGRGHKKWESATNLNIKIIFFFFKQDTFFSHLSLTTLTRVVTISWGKGCNTAAECIGHHLFNVIYAFQSAYDRKVLYPSSLQSSDL